VNVTMPMAFFIIVSQLVLPVSRAFVLMILRYRLRCNAAAYFSHRKRKLQVLCSL